MGQKSWTIKELLEVTTDYLKEKEIDSPRLSAEILLACQLDIDRVELYLNLDQPLQNGEIAGYRSLIRKRLNREPIQHITGVQEFWSMEFMVGPQALIPRPETELLVELVLSLCREERLSQSPSILDLGTGCGPLAICLSKELDRASIWASDISVEALNLARLNARKHGVEDRIVFLPGDLWQPILDQHLTFDIIVSNPPYIPSEAFDSLPPEVRDHEPELALNGGAEGMFFISKIIVEGANYLRSGGWLLLEMDPEQTTKALKLIDNTNKYQKKDRIKDYSHQYRVVMAQEK